MMSPNAYTDTHRYFFFFLKIRISSQHLSQSRFVISNRVFFKTVYADGSIYPPSIHHNDRS